MRSKGTAAELQRRRQLALDRVKDGYTQIEVATFLGVHERTVRRWVAQHRKHGEAGLLAKPHPGRPPKLSCRLANLVLGWLRQNPKSFGFATELWTGARIATLIRRKFKVQYHPNYISAWLLNHGFTHQKPKRQADRRDPAAVQRFVEHDWPRLQNEPASVTLIW